DGVRPGRAPLAAAFSDDRIPALVLEAIDDASPRGIAAAVNRLIRSGRLVTGDRLPTVRDLARDLGISPATVSEAWQALSAVGAIESRGRAGTFVRCTDEPSRPVRYLGIGIAPAATGLDLSTSMPDPALLPALRPALESVTDPDLVWTTSYLDDPVLPRLEELLRADWPFDAQRIGTVDGALDGLARLIEQVVRLGDRVALENPGFPALIDLLEARGAEIVPLEVDELGVTEESLEFALSLEPVALFLQPRAQNPTGASMTAQRVAALAALLRHTRTWIIEADHSGLIAKGDDVSLGRFLPERTVHVRSFSKSHSPDLRTAAIGGAAEVLDPLMARRMLGPGWTSRILQGMLVDLLTDPVAIAAVNRARDVYHHRVSSLRESLVSRGVVCAPADGINLWVQVADERSALLMLAAGGIRVAPGGPFMVQPLAEQYLRITAGLLPDDHEQIDDIGHRIAEAAQARPSVRGGIS
ncbi:MAG: PLP-dependent aminotransferase family protein, partial [Actinomycetales bacterium]